MVIGMDISKEMLEIAKVRANRENLQDRIVFKEGDAENLEFPDNYFDAAICLQTLMHLPNPQKCIDELNKVVKPDGIVVVDHVNKNHLWRIGVRGFKNFFSGILWDIYFKMGPSFRRFFHKLLGLPENPNTTYISKKRVFGFSCTVSGVKLCKCFRIWTKLLPRNISFIPHKGED